MTYVYVLSQVQAYEGGTILSAHSSMQEGIKHIPGYNKKKNPFIANEKFFSWREGKDDDYSEFYCVERVEFKKRITK